MSAHIYRTLVVSLFAALMATAASAQQKPTSPPTVAPIPPATPVQQKPTSPSTVTEIPLAPSAQQKPTPTPAPRTAPPAQPTAPATPPPATTPRAATPAQPAPAAPTAAPPPGTASSRPQPVNFRIEVQVTDRQDGKVFLSETFTALVADYSNSRISRVTAAPLTASLEVSAQSLGSQSADTVRVKLVAQFKLPNNVDVGQEVTSFIVLGKPSTVIDIASGADGARRFLVQVTVVRAPLE